MEKFTINIKATNMELTDSIRDRIEKKFSHLEKFVGLKHDSKAIAQVEVGKTTTSQHHGDIFRAEVNLNLNGKMIRAESIQSDLYVAIENVFGEVANIAKGNKDKRMTLMKRGAQKFKKWMRFGRGE